MKLTHTRHAIPELNWTSSPIALSSDSSRPNHLAMPTCTFFQFWYFRYYTDAIIIKNRNGDFSVCIHTWAYFTCTVPTGERCRYCMQICKCRSAQVWEIALYQTDAVVQHLNSSYTSSQTCLPNRSDLTIEPSSPSTTESDHNYSLFCCYSGDNSDCAPCSKENDRRLLSRSFCYKAFSLCVQVCGSW